jgi:hypothetical protein
MLSTAEHCLLSYKQQRTRRDHSQLLGAYTALLCCTHHCITLFVLHNMQQIFLDSNLHRVLGGEAPGQGEHLKSNTRCHAAMQ